MASCYAALVSLQTTIQSILNHPDPPISLDHDQAQALLQNSAFLQGVLEHHSHREDYPTDDLKNKIIDAVYAAEDLIEKSAVRGSSVRLVLQLAAELRIPFDEDTDEFWMKRIMEENKLGISAAIQDMDAIIKKIKMASFYAAVVSLQTAIRSIQNHRNSLDQHREALLQKSTVFQEFLQRHSHGEDYPTDELKNKIRDAAYAAEDLIEKSTALGSSDPCILQRGAESAGTLDKDIDEVFVKRILDTVDDNLGISFAIQDMDAIIKEITEEHKEKPEDLQLVSSISSLSHASPSAGKKSATVVFDDVLNKLWNMLASKPKSNRQIIPITGMGGIGKTTLATQAYQRDYSQEKHFDVRVFVTISQNFREREFLQDILGQLNENKDMENFYCDNEQMRVKIYQHLIGRRYVWSIDDKLSRIIGMLTQQSIF